MRIIKLSEGLFGFGNGGINRIEPLDKRDGKENPFNSVLYVGTTKISVVKETEDEILYMLKAEHHGVTV